MEMSEVFALPITRIEGGVMPFVNDQFGLVAVVEDRHADAIIKAINMHDDLIAAIQTIVDGIDIDGLGDLCINPDTLRGLLEKAES